VFLSPTDSIVVHGSLSAVFGRGAELSKRLGNQPTVKVNGPETDSLIVSLASLPARSTEFRVGQTSIGHESHTSCRRRRLCAVHHSERLENRGDVRLCSFFGEIERAADFLVGESAA
jgi:hypothetical protein